MSMPIVRAFTISIGTKIDIIYLYILYYIDLYRL